MIVELAACTMFDKGAIQDYRPHNQEAGVTGADELAEAAGRLCYLSWNRPNPKTRTNEGYLGNIIDQGHFSVLEHASASFYVSGVSRSLTHELVRHRHLSYSQLSQRYVNGEGSSFVVPPAIRGNEELEEMFFDATYNASMRYKELADKLLDAGLSRKEAREAARSVLPNATETKLIVTGNLRAWRDFLAKRWHVAADKEIREFAGRVLQHLRDIAPNSVQDLPEAPYGS